MENNEFKKKKDLIKHIFEYPYPQQYQLKPYICPVCNGKGTVPCTFYDNNAGSTAAGTYDVACKTCNGSGVLWG